MTSVACGATSNVVARGLEDLVGLEKNCANEQQDHANAAQLCANTLAGGDQDSEEALRFLREVIWAQVDSVRCKELRGHLEAGQR